jgi:hypothetical protein
MKLFVRFPLVLCYVVIHDRISSSASYSQTFSAYVLPSTRKIKFHTHVHFKSLEERPIAERYFSLLHLRYEVGYQFLPHK